jgi:enamine deaminase RidA (YjgF/YER057c/UK114 family)
MAAAFSGRDDLTRISSGSPFEPTIGFSRAVRLGDRVLVSGTGPVPPPGERCPEDAAAQARRCFAIVETALGEAGATLEDVVRTRMYITDVADADAVGAAHGALFGAVRPAATMVVVAGLLDPAWRVEVEAEAVVRTGRLDPTPGKVASGPEDGNR